MSVVLSATQALLFSGIITSSYVGGLYIAPSTRLSFIKTSEPKLEDRARQANERWRDDDDVIRGRLTAALLSTCASCGAVYMCVASTYHDDKWTRAIAPTLQLLGINLPTPNPRAILPHFLIPLLYTGPLTARFLSATLPFQRFWSFRENFWPIFTTWIGLRNFIVAPITEEVVFRACLLAISSLSGKGLYQKLFVTPLWFGVAHLHHAYELYNRFGRTKSAATRAVITCLVQMTYTTLFGAYTSFLFLRTGSILPAITAHIIANIMGLPELGWELRQHPKNKLLICTAYAVGIAAFILASGPWTA